MFLQRMFRRLMRLRLYFFIFVLVLSGLFAYFGTGILGVFVNTCEERPTYRPDVPPDVRGRVDVLFDNDLLFCPEPSDPFEGLDGPIYWGTDGLRSVLFFQADSLRGIGVRRYAYGQNFTVQNIGDAPPPGYNPVRAGRRVYSNQAISPTDGEAPNYFFRQDGAPRSDDLQVEIVVRGRAAPDERIIGGGDVFDDLEALWDRLSGSGGSREERVGSALTRSVFPILSETWEERVRRQAPKRWAREDGVPAIALVNEVPPDAPAVSQTMTALLTNSIWVAGVDIELVPRIRIMLDGEAIEPVETTVWSSDVQPVALALFAFDPLPSATPLQAEFWADGRAARDDPPDAVWEVTFP